MADEIDATADRMDNELALTVRDACRVAAAIPKGQPGECHYCGEHFARVVTVTDPASGDKVESCGRCRDRRGIP